MTAGAAGALADAAGAAGFSSLPQAASAPVAATADAFNRKERRSMDISSLLICMYAELSGIRMCCRKDRPVDYSGGVLGTEPHQNGGFR
jgi:hypothetical protein